MQLVSVEALLLDPDHPHAGIKHSIKSWCQKAHSECLAQLAVHEQGREALLAHSTVVPALQALADTGWSEEARNFANAALVALENKKIHSTGGQKHVMLSYQWDVQAIIQRLNNWLQRRGYLTWFDLTNMKGECISRHLIAPHPLPSFSSSSHVNCLNPKWCLCAWIGSTMDAMSAAIEGAEVMLYGVSLRYKESANVCDLLLRKASWSSLSVFRQSSSIHLPDCVCCMCASADWRLTTPTSKSWT